MTTLYKLTDKNNCTYHGSCQWGEGVEHIAPGIGNLCTSGWLHAYTDPLLAILLNPEHANIPHRSCRLWLADGDVGATDYGRKVGCTRLKTIRRIHKTVISDEKLIKIALLCGVVARKLIDRRGNELHGTGLRIYVAYVMQSEVLLDGADTLALVHKAMDSR